VIAMHGQPLRIDDPALAATAGIGVIYQEFNLIPALNPVENIFLGRESGAGLIARSRERQQAKDLFERMGVHVPLHQPVRELSVAHQQLIEIAKALMQDVRVLVMDEPSAALTPQEVGHLFRIVRELQSQGIGIVYVSHRLDEVFELADAVTVLRDGLHVADRSITELSRRQLIELMVGRSIEEEFPKISVPAGDVRLEVHGLRRGVRVQNVSFCVRRGEVLGVTGLIGAGRTEMVRLISGADRADAGSILLDGRALRIRSPRDAIRAGICLLTEDRKSQGLIPGRSVLENFGLANLRQFSRCGVLRRRQESHAFQRYVERLKIRIPHQQQLARNLSGGNQQKVVLARWLQQNAEVIIFDEPTRGIDVGAKHEIYQLMNELTAAGKALIMISSELPEVMGMSDRILVMREGRISGELTDVCQVTQQQIMELAVPGPAGSFNSLTAETAS
ncbi:MAG: sugar ABC transporter ATP-binding protein, partial [Planctomycetaceae bacterium]|nr:sugar ABC transporter ATP-binding protein [Planctomycetaceae bacterium]